MMSGNDSAARACALRLGTIGLATFIVGSHALPAAGAYHNALTAPPFTGWDQGVGFRVLDRTTSDPHGYPDLSLAASTCGGVSTALFTIGSPAPVCFWTSCSGARAAYACFLP